MEPFVQHRKIALEQQTYQFNYLVYPGTADLDAEDRLLLEEARAATAKAIAPYSGFSVGAAVKLLNGAIVTGGNQENISFPAGLCAERVALSTASSLYPGVAVTALAVSYRSTQSMSDHPITPCGVCRQSLQELWERSGTPIRLVLGGMEGSVWVIPDASGLMPLSFTF